MATTPTTSPVRRVPLSEDPSEVFGGPSLSGAGGPGFPGGLDALTELGSLVDDQNLVLDEFGGPLHLPTPRTVGALLGRLASLPEAQMAALQRRMLEAGFYPDDIYTGRASYDPGYADAPTRSALKGLVAQAVADYPRGKNIDAIMASATIANRDWIAKLREMGASDGREPNRQRAATVTTSDPASLRLAAEEIGKDLLGRKPDAGQVEKIIAKVQAMQAANQQAEISNEVTAANTSTGDDVGVRVIQQNQIDPNAQIATEIKRQNAPLVGAQSMAEGYNQLLRLIGGGQG